MNEYMSHDEEIRAVLQQAKDERDTNRDNYIACEDQLKIALETIKRLRTSKVAEIEERPEDTCEWWQDGDDEHSENWHGECGAVWVFTQDGVAENGLRYCPECGRLVRVREAKDGK